MIVSRFAISNNFFRKERKYYPSTITDCAFLYSINVFFSKLLTVILMYMCNDCVFRFSD
jgi:hypothetical protein